MSWGKRLGRYMGWGNGGVWEGDAFGNGDGLVDAERLGRKTGWEGRRVCGEIGWEGHGLAKGMVLKTEMGWGR